MGNRHSVPHWIGHASMSAALLMLLPGLCAGRANYKRTDSRSQYVHRLTLYDAHDRPIDPSSPAPPPYSPRHTCKKCHDVGRIMQGYHFSADAATAGRAGTPWVWTHRKTGSQILLSRRGWPGTHRPEDVGLSALQFVVQFGGHLCGGQTPPAPVATGNEAARWKISGTLDVDCMLCHTSDGRYSYEQWAKQIGWENFGWAATAALGLGKVTGMAKNLPDNFDPSHAGAKGVHTTYDKSRFDAAGKVFFPVVRRPPNNACYACHTTRLVGHGAPPPWTHDQDIHLRAGFLCADCHRNGIEHHTVRGFPDEMQPTGISVRTLSCRGCHMDDHVGGVVRRGGRLGAPKPRHAGLPPLHLERIACPTCHSGPRPKRAARAMQTSMTHGLGIASQTRSSDDPPGVVAPVFRRNPAGVIAPYRMTWPAFWGWLVKGNLEPANPDRVNKSLRRVLRVRKDFRTELGRVRLTAEEKVQAVGVEAAGRADRDLTAEQQAKLDVAKTRKAATMFKDKLAKGLKKLAGKPPVEGAVPVYVAGGKVYQLDQTGAAVRTSPHQAAEPYAWPLAHDVRPARQALGADGCTECHAAGSAFFHGRVTAVGPAPDAAPKTVAMDALMGEDPAVLEAWEWSFRGRTSFKWLALLALAVVLVAGTRTAPRPRLVWLVWLLYPVTLACVALLLLTSFGALWQFDVLTGWMLLAHVAIGGLLIVLLPVLAVLRAGLHGAPSAEDSSAGPRGGLTGALFWLLLACGFLTAGTMLLSMLPLLGTDAMEWLLGLHRYAGIALAIVALAHVVFVVMGRMNRQQGSANR